MAAIPPPESSCLFGSFLFLVWLVIYNKVLCTALYMNCSAYVIEDLNAPVNLPYY